MEQPRLLSCATALSRCLIALTCCFLISATATKTTEDQRASAAKGISDAHRLRDRGGPQEPEAQGGQGMVLYVYRRQAQSCRSDELARAGPFDWFNHGLMDSEAAGQSDDTAGRGAAEAGCSARQQDESGREQKVKSCAKEEQARQPFTSTAS